MAITFLEQKKKQQKLLLILLFIIIIICFIVWRGLLRKEEEVVFEEITSEIFRGVNINFQFLQDFVPEDFESFEEAPAFEEQIGRENPFLPLSPLIEE